MHMNNRKLQNFSACGGPTAGRMCFLLIGTFVCHMPTSKLIYTACALTGRVPGRFAGVGARFYHSQIKIIPFGPELGARFDTFINYYRMHDVDHDIP